MLAGTPKKSLACIGLGNSIELPSDFPSGSLACYTPSGSPLSKRFAWLSGPGLYRGDLKLAADEKLLELDYLSDHNLLPLPMIPELTETPLSVVRTCVVCKFVSHHILNLMIF